MKHQVAFLSLVAGVCMFGAQAKAADHTMLTPADLKWTDVPAMPAGSKIAIIEGDMKAAEPFTARLKFPPSTKIPPHWHDTVEHVTVISGSFNRGVGDTLDPSKAKKLDAGSVAVMPQKVHHFGVTGAEETTLQLHGTGPWTVTYVNPADDLRKKTN
jgi:quercetin dioxygenase-like cupin family protein